MDRGAYRWATARRLLMDSPVVLPPDRRRAPRIGVVEDRIRVIEVGARYEVRLVDVSAGGFLTSTPVPYPIDAERSFVFLDDRDRWQAPLSGRVIYSHTRAGRVDAWPEYLTGFSFVGAEDPDVATRIDEILAHAIDDLRA